MNKPLIVIALTFATLTAFGQGSVTFSNSGMLGGGLIRVSTGALVPIGSSFQVALFWAPKDTPDSQFGSVAQQLGASIGFGPTAGSFSGGGRTINGLTPPGDVAKFQVRVWETAYGSSLCEVACNPDPNAEWGMSAPFLVDTANPLIGEPNASIGPLIPRFTLGAIGGATPPLFCPCIPEPSTLLLGISAGALLLLFRKITKSEIT